MMLIIDAGLTDADCFISLYNVRTPKTYQNSVVYEFKCPGCNANYVGKTDRCMYTRIKENSSHDSSEIMHEFNFIRNLVELTSKDEGFNIKCSLTDSIFTNTN